MKSLSLGRVNSSLSVILTVALLLVVLSVPTHAATFTWTGGGGDANFSTDANWQGGTAPTGSGTDELVFDPTLADFEAKVPNNDLDDATFATITAQNVDETNYDYATIVGNAFSLSGGASADDSNLIIKVDLTLTANQTLNSIEFGEYESSSHSIDIGSNDITITGYAILYGPIEGTGSIAYSGDGFFSVFGDNTYTGLTTVGVDSQVVMRSTTALGATSSGTVVASGGVLYILGDPNKVVIDEPISVGGSGINGHGAIVPASLGNGGLGGSGKVELTDVTLTSNTVVGVYSPGVLEITSIDKGGYTIKNRDGNTGTLIVEGDTLEAEAIYTVVSKNDRQPNLDVTVYGNYTLVVNGERGDIFVSGGGLLMGTGTVGALSMGNDGTVAPGTSPGCLSSGNVNFTGGELQIEIAGTKVCDEYDQLNVTGTVNLLDFEDSANAVLDVTFLDGYLPKKGDVFTVLKNDGSDAIEGNFKGLAEGDTYSNGDANFRISYEGGSGNDITLTVLNVPGAPDTGFPLLEVNTLIPIVSTIAVVGGLLLAKRQFATSKTQ